MVAHFGGAAGSFLTGGLAGWIAPLVARLAQGDRSPVVREQATAALNFQILWTIIAVIGYATMCALIGFVIVPIAWLIGTIFGIVAGAKASNGESYRYPLSMSMVK